MSQSNGGNPRLDRIEKMIEEGQRASREAYARHERAVAEHDRMMAEHNRTMRRTDDRLNRFIQFGVKEARNQRKRRQELDEKITQLAAAQLVTEEKLDQLAAAQVVTEEQLQRFISSLGRSGNGKGEGKR